MVPCWEPGIAVARIKMVAAMAKWLGIGVLVFVGAWILAMYAARAYYDESSQRIPRGSRLRRFL